MAECKNDSKVDVLEERVKVVNKRIDDLEEKTKELPKLEVMMNMVIETNKDLKETLKSIDDNLDGLNNNYDNLNTRLGVLESDISEVKNDNKIDLPKLKKDIIMKVIPSLIGGVILAWLLFTFNLK